MKGSYRIAKVFGIPVDIHWSFGLLMIWVVYSSYESGADYAGIIWNVVFFLSIFFCVVLHEFGHALTARRFGVQTKDIILSPIGGVARLDKLPEKPIQEFLVAIAGPAVNIAIALVLSTYFLVNPQYDFVESVLSGRFFQSGVTFIPALIVLNVLLALFNLIPAFPMDGGRVFRALLSVRFSRYKATLIATRVGQGMAVFFMCYGFFTEQFVTTLIGLFVFFMANQEFKSVKFEESLGQIKVRHKMRSIFTQLKLDDEMELVAQIFQQGIEKNYIVTDDACFPIGVVTAKTIVETFEKYDLDAKVNSFYLPFQESVNVEDSLKDAHQLFVQFRIPVIPVFELGLMVGVLDAEKVYDKSKTKVKLFSTVLTL